MNTWKDVSNIRVFKTLRMKFNAVIIAEKADGTINTIAASEIAALANLAAGDIEKIEGITNGTAAASKALVLDASLNISGINNISGMTGLINESAATAITAGTTRTQAGATALTKEINRVDTSTAPAAGSTLGDGVSLPASAAGLSIVVVNNTANPIQVYGAGTDTINGVATATGIPIPPNSTEIFVCAAAGTWSCDAGVGSSGALNTVLSADSVSAAGANQGAATQLVADFNRVTTATVNQGVKLPASAPGMDVLVINHTGVSITVYGAGTDKIDDVASATGVSQMDSSVVLFTCYAAGNWYSNGLATGYAKNPTSGSVLETIQNADALTAIAGGIGSALQLLAGVNTIGTCPSGGGVILPVSAPGLQVTVINSGANALLVFGDTTNTPTINGAANTVGVLILPGTASTFNCTNANAWTASPFSSTSAAYNTSNSAVSFSASAANVTGGTAFVELDLTGNPAGAANVTLPTATSVIALLHGAIVGTSFVLRIKNSANSNTWTVVDGTNFVGSGTKTIATGTWRDFLVKVTAVSGTPALTYQNLGGGATL